MKINKKERIAVLICKDCINELKRYNPYTDSNGNPLEKSNIELIEVPLRFCKNRQMCKSHPINITGVDEPFIVRTFNKKLKYFKHFNNAKKYALERALKHGDSKTRIFIQNNTNDFMLICEFKTDYTDISIEYDKLMMQKEIN